MSPSDSAHLLRASNCLRKLVRLLCIIQRYFLWWTHPRILQYGRFNCRPEVDKNYHHILSESVKTTLETMTISSSSIADANVLYLGIATLLNDNHWSQLEQRDCFENYSIALQFPMDQTCWFVTLTLRVMFQARSLNSWIYKVTARLYLHLLLNPDWDNAVSKPKPSRKSYVEMTARVS